MRGGGDFHFMQCLYINARSVPALGATQYAGVFSAISKM